MAEFVRNSEFFLGPFWVIFGPLGSFWSQQEGVSFFFVANLVITCFWG